MKNPFFAATLVGALSFFSATSWNASSIANDQSDVQPSEQVASNADESAPRSGVVTIRTSSSDPLVANALARCSYGDVDRVVADVARLVAAAKQDYSPVYGAKSGATREQLVSQLRDYLSYAETPGRAEEKELATKLQFADLVKLSEESPSIFRNRLKVVSEALSNYARSSKKNMEREKSLAVLMDYYLAVFEASEATSSELTDDSVAENADASEVEQESDTLTDEEIEREKRELFEYYCDALESETRAYFNGDENGSLDGMTRALGEMRYYQSESPAVGRLASYLRSVFCDSNFYLEASERFLSAFTYREVSENFDVNEMIRGTMARGNGVLRGHTFIDVTPSANRARMAIALNANVSTRTVGANRGVYVHSDNLGSVYASKPIYLNQDGLISTSAAVANANMKTTVRGINTDRITLLGGKIIQNKVSQELPFSERDGAERMKARVAKDLDEQANAQILEMNRRVAHMEIGSASSMIRDLTSSSSEDRIFLSCVLGRGVQFSTLEKSLDAIVGARRGASAKDGYASAETSESSAQEYYDQRPLRRLRENSLAALAPNLRNNQITAASSSSVFPKFEPFKNLRATALEKKTADAKPDLVVRFHQSAPNNAATIALAGALFGPGYDSLDNVILRFPGVDPTDVKRLLEPYEPNGDRALDPEDSARRVFVRFDEVQPFSTRFDDGRITTTLRISSCDVDGKEWGPIEVRMVYRMEVRGNQFAFVRDELEVLPGGYQEGDAVSARFYTFRRIFIKRLEVTINDEYVLSPLPVDVIATMENRGSLVPRKVEIDNGWARAEFDLVGASSSATDDGATVVGTRFGKLAR